LGSNGILETQDSVDEANKENNNSKGGEEQRTEGRWKHKTEGKETHHTLSIRQFIN
jgi:hypothetical protein